MSKNAAAMLAGAVLALWLPGCSSSEPVPRDFVLIGQRPAKAKEAGNTLAAATAACKLETERKGIKSVASIFSRLRPGSADRDFVACMRQRGYEPVE